jgi:hypothetical protein
VPLCIYYLEDQELIVVCRKNRDELQLFDVVSRRDVRIGDFIGAFVQGAKVRLIFEFTPEFPDITPLVETLELEQADAFFMKPAAFSLPEGSLLPLTARA